MEERRDGREALIRVRGRARAFDGEVHRTTGKKKKVMDLPGGIWTSLGAVKRLKTVANG